jgi:hypothetical protein
VVRLTAMLKVGEMWFDLRLCKTGRYVVRLTAMLKLGEMWFDLRLC